MKEAEMYIGLQRQKGVPYSLPSKGQATFACTEYEMGGKSLLGRHRELILRVAACMKCALAAVILDRGTRELLGFETQFYSEL
jgi:hypothetical protein